MCRNSSRDSGASEVLSRLDPEEGDQNLRSAAAGLLDRQIACQGGNL